MMKDALTVLKQKKNRIILVLKSNPVHSDKTIRTVLNGVLVQERDLNPPNGKAI
jgi:AICAR transformylase/IMP cyclohydrolase PurH